MKVPLMTLLSLFALVASLHYCLAADELNVEVVEEVENCERKSEKGDRLSMHYTGKLLDGKEFDSSLRRNKPFDFTLGVGQVIRGWDEGLMNMCIGEKRKLTIPPHLGYGDSGAGADIPGGATLVFDVELLDIKNGESEPNESNIFKQIDKDEDKMLTKEELKSFIVEQTANMGEEGQADPGMDHDKIIDDILEQEDTDKDGQISFEEFSGPKHEEL